MPTCALLLLLVAPADADPNSLRNLEGNGVNAELRESRGAYPLQQGPGGVQSDPIPPEGWVPDQGAEGEAVPAEAGVGVAGEEGADVEGAGEEGADVEGADVEGAGVEGADVEDADVEEAGADDAVGDDAVGDDAVGDDAVGEEGADVEAAGAAPDRVHHAPAAGVGATRLVPQPPGGDCAFPDWRWVLTQPLSATGCAWTGIKDWGVELGDTSERLLKGAPAADETEQ